MLYSIERLDELENWPGYISTVKAGILLFEIGSMTEAFCIICRGGLIIYDVKVRVIKPPGEIEVIDISGGGGRFIYLL